MSRSLILVLKNKGGVGATTTATLLCDYLGAKANRFRVFDGQAPNGSLRRRYTDAEIVAFGTTAGRMRVVDGLGDFPTLVDIPADLGSQTIEMLRDVGFLDEVAIGKAKLSVVHVLAPNVDSLSEAAEIAARLGEGCDHFIVKNCVNDPRFTQDSGDFTTRADALKLIGAKGVAEIGHLDGSAREAADAAGGTFNAFILDDSKSYMLRKLVQKWWADAFKSFDAAGMRALAIG